MKIIAQIKQVLFQKNALGSFLWFTLLGYLRPAINVFLLPLYLTYLSPEDYGLLALVGLFTAIAMVFANLKIDTAMRTFYFDYNEDEQQLQKYLAQIFSFTLFSVSIYFCIFWFIGPFLYELAFVSDTISYYPYGIVSLAAAVLASCTNVYLVFLKNKLQLKEFAFYSVSNILCTVFFQAYFIIVKDMGIMGILLGNLIPNIAILVIMILKNPTLITIRFDKKMLIPSLKFALPLIPYVLLVVVEKQLDKFVLEKYMTLEQVGIYAILMSLVGLSKTLMAALDNAIRPFLYEDLKQKTPESTTRINDYLSLYFLVGLLCLSGIIMVGSNLHLLTDDERYLQVRPYFTMACIAAIPFLFVRYFAMIYVFYKKSGSLTLITFLKTAIVLALLLVLIPSWGIMGAIIAVLISNLINQFIFAQQIKNFGAPPLKMQFIFMKVSIFISVTAVLYCLIDKMTIGWYGILQFCLISIILLLIDRKSLVSMAKNKL